MQAPHANDIRRVLAMQKNVIADFVQSRFPDQFLIPVADFAKLAGESFGGCRNRIAAGTFDLRVVQRGSRNFVTATDVIDYIARLVAGEKITPQQAKPKATEREEKPNGRRRSKYGEEAKARAAVARAARAAKREARATTVRGVA